MYLSQKVNYIQHLNNFYRHARDDERLHANDMSLYMALFQVWNRYNFRVSFPVVREELMSLSRIGSRDTYMNCMRRLHTCGYIKYQRSTFRYAPAYICIMLFNNCSTPGPVFQPEIFPEETKTGPQDGPDSGPGPGPETGPRRGPKSGHFIKLITNYNKLGKVFTPKKQSDSINQNHELHKKTFAPPEISEVQNFFLAASQREKEARKFYHHYEAIGWKLNNAPITNWYAAANKWIENIYNHKNSKNGTVKPGTLHVNTTKDYNSSL